MKALIKALLYICTLLFVSSAWAQTDPGPRFTIQGTLTPAQQSQVATSFITAYKSLPPIMRIRLEGYAKFNSYTLNVIPMDEHVAGEANKKGTIVINSRLLNKTTLIQRTLIHELSHVYDFLRVLPQDIQAIQNDCVMWKDHYREQGVPDHCELYQKTNTTVSTMPDFLDVTGWYQTLNGKGQRLKNTTLGFRSPDPYEQVSPYEMFAVNMEYFLTDKEFQCRRPSIYRYLANHFKYTPFFGQPCVEALSFVDPNFDTADKAIKTIDPNRVYAIHYLLAGDGEDFMSAFGHSMIRVVTCAPERKVVGPDCLQDIGSHIVLSFRAFVDTPQISGWAGMTGAYPSRLFFIPFPQIINEYNVTQLRELSSYPMQLSREEIKTFLQRAVETHWNYSNNYKFLSNNCAVEVINMLKGGLIQSALMNSRVQTPKGVLQELKNKNLIAHDALEDLNQAQADGLYFASYENNLKQALTVIKNLSNQQFSISKWSKVSALERRQLYTSMTFNDKLSTRKWSAAFLFLERYLEKQLTKKTYARFLESSESDNSKLGQQSKSYTEKILATLAMDQDLTSPVRMAKAGYGIPSQPELADVEAYLFNLQQKRKDNQAALTALANQLLQLYGSAEVDQTRANLLIFAQGLKSN